MITIQTQSKKLPTRRGLSGLVIALIMVGIGAGATFAVMGGVLDNLDSMAATNRVVIESVNAYTNGDHMVITGNVKNLGSQPIESITIDEITAGDLIITQSGYTEDGVIVDNHGDMSLTGLDDVGDDVSDDNVDYDDATAALVNTVIPSCPGSAIGAGNATKFYFGDGTTCMAHVDVTGLSTSENNLVSLPAGSTQSFRLMITGKSAGGSADVLDVLRTVPASTSLFITISGTDGQTSTISDPRTVRVTAR